MTRSVPVGILTAVIALGTLSCSGTRPNTLPVSEPGPRSVYVALGNGETAGNGVPDRIRDAWPQIVYRKDLPASTVFANFGQNDATVQEALDTQLQPALSLRPTIATVHITDDRQIDAATFERRLTELVTRLQDANVPVVVGNLLPGDREPGFLACLPDAPPDGLECRIGPIADPTRGNQRRADFNEAIARVTKATGARLVDLHGAFMAARARGEEDALWEGNDFSPNEAGHALIAEQFGAAVRAVTTSVR